MLFQCSQCEALYGSAIEKDWGKTRETSGLGPQVKCPAIVLDENTRAGRVCGGTLGLVNETAARLEAAIPLTPL